MDKDNLLLITIYPPKDSIHGNKVGGVASYAKNTVLTTQEHFNYTILAQHNDENETEFTEGPHRIIRCWRANTFTYVTSLIFQLIKRRRNLNRLMIQFEFGIFGTEFKTGLFPLVLIAARLLGYKVTLVQHQVVGNLSELREHLGLIGLKKSIYTFLMRTFIGFMTLLPNRIIVFDQVHKNKLIEIRQRVGQKVYIIPHGVESLDQNKVYDTTWYDEIVGKEDAFTILLFGFIANYKGSLLAASHFHEYTKAHPDTDFKLILAGGESPTQKDSTAYKDYYSKVTQLASGNSHIIHTGFVPEDQIAIIHEKADLVLLPYQTLMSSSGPLSFAIKHQKPFLLSNVLQPYTLTEDFQTAINKHFSKNEDYPILDLQKENIFAQIVSIRKNEELMNKLSQVSKDLYSSRQWPEIGKQYTELLT